MSYYLMSLEALSYDSACSEYLTAYDNSTVKPLEQFLDDPKAWDMFITGPAGTGKTTSLKTHTDWCIANNVPYQVCAYTHKACAILRSKQITNVCTLHSFLKKRPSININATKLKHIDTTTSANPTLANPKLIFIDEFSMVGEKDLADLRLAQDPDYTASPEFKLVWIGDLNQLPPVGDKQTLIPNGPYHTKLTKQYRNDNGLQAPLTKLISYIEGTAQPATLAPNDLFVRNTDIVKEYNACTDDKILLAYTNKRVQQLNIKIAGRSEPTIGDTLFSPTTKQTYTFQGWATAPTRIARPFGDPLELNSKYRTLEGLQDYKFAYLDDEYGESCIMAVVFGHYNYKVELQELKLQAVETNKDIEAEHPGMKAAVWARNNYTTQLARSRAKAWRKFLSFDECVVCVDFPYATTVHKAQGSTYGTVFIDTDDLAICKDFDTYLKLTYVAISRAQNKVYTS